MMKTKTMKMKMKKMISFEPTFFFINSIQFN
jgi:hypothetical protein